MQRYSDIQSPYDPYDHTQIAFIRNSGYKHWEFQSTRDMNATEIRRAKLFGVLIVVGIIALAILESAQ